MIDEDVMACYNMSLKDFEHSSVHDLFKVCEPFFFFFFFLNLKSRPFSNVYMCILSNKILTYVGNV